MADYYPLLRRTVGALDSNDAETRRKVYERAWTAARNKWRALDPPPSEDQIRAEFAALKAAIERVESECAQPSSPAPVAPATPAAVAAPAPPPSVEPQRTPTPPAPVGATAGSAPPRWVKWAALGALAAVAVVIGAVAAIQHGGRKAEEADATQPARQPQRAARVAIAPYVFTRQPVYYRTTHPAGTVVIDKAQRFLYVIQPNVVAIRYGLSIGPDCGEVLGLRTVAAKHDITALPPPDEIKDDRRYLLLDPGTLRLNATTDLAAIGSAVPEGCFRVSPEDVSDLFARVQVGTRVVVAN